MATRKITPKDPQAEAKVKSEDKTGDRTSQRKTACVKAHRRMACVKGH